MFDFRDQPVAELARRIRSKELSAREVVDHALNQIERLNPELNAFVSVDPDRARRDAAAIDLRLAQGDDPGPLAGIPIGVKDLEAVEGFVTTYGSALRANDPPAPADCVHVARYRAAGAIIIGKTNTPEYGHKGATDNPLFGQTKNPWSLAHSPGGSSGGTGAAIAAGMVPLATGSDGGGSIRIPGALCGLSVIKTEAARIPISGTAMPGSGLLSTNGPMGWRIADSAYALDVAIGHDGGDPLSLPHPGVSWHEQIQHPSPPARAVWAPTFGFATVDDEVLSACDAAVKALEAAGTEVITVDSIWDEDPGAAWYTLWCVARYKAQGHLIGTPDFDRISETLQPQILTGAGVTGLEHAQAHDAMYALNAPPQRGLRPGPDHSQPHLCRPDSLAGPARHDQRPARRRLGEVHLRDQHDPQPSRQCAGRPEPGRPPHRPPSARRPPRRDRCDADHGRDRVRFRRKARALVRATSGFPGTRCEALPGRARGRACRFHPPTPRRCWCRCRCRPAWTGTFRARPTPEQSRKGRSGY